MGVDVRQVGRVMRMSPQAARSARSHASRSPIAQEIEYRALIVIVVNGILLQAIEQVCRVHVRPVGEEHDVIAIAGEGWWFDRIDDQDRRAALLPEAEWPGTSRSALADIELVEITGTAGDAVSSIPARRPCSPAARCRASESTWCRRIEWARSLLTDPHPRAFPPAQKGRDRAVQCNAGRPAGVVDERLPTRRSKCVPASTSRCPASAARSSVRPVRPSSAHSRPDPGRTAAVSIPRGRAEIVVVT